MPTRIVIVALLALAVGSPPAAAQRVKVTPDQQWVILEIMKLSTLGVELNDAAKQGFRLKMTAVEGPRVSALMERTETAAATPYEYRIVNTFSSKTGDKEMNAAGAEGFRVVPNTFMVKKGFTVFNVDNVVIMERAPAREQAHEYLTINAARTSTLDKELRDALGQGWRVLDLTHGQILLERPVS